MNTIKLNIRFVIAGFRKTKMSKLNKQGKSVFKSRITYN
jgi:hypothetical protein